MRQLAVAAVLLALLPVAAEAAEEPTRWADPCGDEVRPLASAQGTPVRVAEEQRRSPRHDVREASIHAVAGGVDVSVRLCAPLGDEGSDVTTHEVNALLPSGCDITVQLDDDPMWGRSAQWFSYCPPEEGGAPVAQQRWYRELPASSWSVEGDTVTWRLRTDELPGLESTPLTPGARWTALRAFAGWPLSLSANHGTTTAGPVTPAVAAPTDATFLVD
jgi:hypothetical protein